MIGRSKSNSTKEHPLDPEATLPDIDADLIKALEALYPPKCYTGDTSIEEHLLYAGRVLLIAELREECNRQIRDAITTAIDGEDFEVEA
jgi:hypothetical protein